MIRTKQLEVIDYCWILHAVSSTDMHVLRSMAVNTNTHNLPCLFIVH